MGIAYKICKNPLFISPSPDKKPRLECSTQTSIPLFKKDVVQLEFLQTEAGRCGQTRRRPQPLRVREEGVVYPKEKRGGSFEKSDAQREGVICHLC